MEFLQVLKNRRSVRSFRNEPVSDDIINQILEAGRISPSTQNRQCWRFIVVKDKEIISKIAYHSFIGTVNYFIKDAPFLIVACADTNKAVRLNNQDYYLVDVAIAFQQMILTAWNFEIASCWLAAFNEKNLKSILHIPDHVRIVALSPFGYPKEKPGLYAKTVSFLAGSKKRLGIDSIVHYNIWNNQDIQEKITEGDQHEA